MNAVGDPSKHPLKGIEQTKWTPAWSHELEHNIDRVQAALGDLRAVTDSLGAAIGLPLSTWDFAEFPGFAKIVSLLLQTEARSGARLLRDDAAARFQALQNLADLVTRAKAKAAELTAPYDLKATRLDLLQMQKDWAEAGAANFLVKGGKKNKVRLLLKPYCASEVPAEIGRDLVMLQDLAEVEKAIELLRPAFAGTLATGWDDDLIQKTNRWKANLIKAPQWVRWKAATIAANQAGLSALVAAVEAGKVPGDLILPTFEFSYARWCAETMVNGDDVLSSFLAEQHEAAIEAFTAADIRRPRRGCSGRQCPG